MNKPAQPADREPAEKWLAGEARTAQLEIAVIAAVGIVSAGLIILQARILSSACAHVVMHGGLPATLTAPVVLLVGIALCRGLVTYGFENRTARLTARLKTRIRSLLFRRLLDAGPAAQGGEGTGSLVETITAGVDGLEPWFGRFLPQLILAGALPLLTGVAVLSSDWRSGLVLLLSAPFIPVLMILIGRGAERLSHDQWSVLARMSDHLMDRIIGLPDLKILGAVKREAEAVRRVSEAYRKSTMVVLRVAFLSAFTLEFFATVGTAVVAVLVGFRLLWGTLTLEDGLFVLLLAPEFYLPLRQLGMSFHARMQGIASAGSIVALLKRAVPQPLSGTMIAPADAPIIRFENVSYRYGDRGGVCDIDLVLSPGITTVLCGVSGAGKTTVARLLTGLLRPTDGRIYINDAALGDIAPDAWRASLAWVPQSPFFQEGTVAENLLIGHPGASEEAMFEALRNARADDFVGRLPQGLNTRLGNRGAGLSGGELRRLALARAFLRNSRVVILDEPTSGLDAENERLILEALRTLSFNRTVLVISHREGILDVADQRIDMAGGRIIHSSVLVPS